MERDHNIDMETDPVETGCALLSELGLQKITPLNIPTDMPGPANINIQDLGLQFEEDISIPENIEAPESTQPSAPESAKRKDSIESNTEKEVNEHEDIVVESDPAAMLGCFFTDSETDFDKPPKTPGGESNTEENCNQTESFGIQEESISIDSLGTHKHGTNELNIKTDSGATSIPVGNKIRYLDDELGWNESEQSFGTKNHERGGVVVRISLPRLEEVDMRNLIKKEACKSSKRKSKHKKHCDTYFTRRMYYYKKRRKCDFCRKYFFNETCLKMHKKSNCPQLWPYPCEKCGNRYKHKGKLREHILTKCGTEKVFACKVCNKSYLYERQLIEHITPVCKSSLYFRCDHCNYTFKSQERLNEHVLSKCDRERVFKCDTCQKRYILKSQLIEHLTPICRALRRLNCEYCEMTFKKPLSLNLHKSNAHGIGNEILCDKCGEMVNGPEQFRAHRKKHQNNRSGFDLYDLEDKSYLCKYCGKCFKSKVTLRGHLRTHSDGHLLACTICGKSLRSFSLRSHMRTHDNVVKAFSCRLCQKGFQRRRELDRHMAGHSNEKPHFCRDCGKSFASIDQLRSHSAVHTGLKSHFCHICGNSYLNRLSLKRHVQRVHLKKRENVCTQCGKSFQALEDLLDHHQHEPNCFETKCDVKPYVCYDCETCFESSESFLYHTGNNLNDQPLMCNACGKFFPRITCLNSHLLTHKQSLICDRCGESFEDSLSLGLHSAICGIIQHVSSNEFMLTTCENKLCLCNQCGEQFSNIYDLTCHSLIHVSNEPFKFDSVDIKSTAKSSSEEINIKKEIAIDVPLECERVTNVSLPNTSTTDYFNLQQVGDIPFKFESVPGISLLSDDSVKDSHILPFNSDMALALNYEGNNEISATYQKTPNNIKNEIIPLPLKDDVAIKKFSCNICGRLLAHSKSLRRHMTNVHSQLQCKNGETSQVTSLKQDPEIKPVTCEGCGKAFGEMQHLKNHVCKLHPSTIKDNLLQDNSFKQIDEPLVTSHIPISDVKPVLCNKCGRAFSEMRYLKRHICKVHSTSTQNNLPQKNTFKKTKETTVKFPIPERKPVICGGCGRTFSEMRNLRKHICKARSTEIQANVILGNSFNRIDKSLIIPSQDVKEHAAAAFTESGMMLSMPLLNGHNITDSRGEFSSSKLDNIAPDAEKRPPECQKCHKKFRDAWSLKKHNSYVNCLSSKTTQLEPLSCDVCGKIFKQRYNLKRHKIVHITETPFKCVVCNKGFKQDKMLQNHMVEAHNLPYSESSFPCDICGKLFIAKSRLQNHIQRAHIHRKFECDECGISCNKRSQLSKHRMVAHGEKSKCRICQQVCTSIDTLVEHLRYIHKEVIDESAPSEELISLYRDENLPFESAPSQDNISMFIDENSLESTPLEDLISMYSYRDESPPSGEKEKNSEEVSSLETKRVELKLPLNDKNMLMFEAYESLLLEACPLEPSVSAKKVNGDINCQSSEEELVKLEYVLGS